MSDIKPCEAWAVVDPKTHEIIFFAGRARIYASKNEAEESMTPLGISAGHIIWPVTITC